MFENGQIDQENITKTTEEEQAWQKPVFDKKNSNIWDNIRANPIVYKVLYALISAVILGIVILLLVRVFLRSKPPAPTPNTATTTQGLPDDLGDGNQGDDNSDPGDLVKAEKLTWGDFYESPDKEVDINLEQIEMPINIKLMAANYYDVNRKINLDSYTDDLNDRGFSIITNFSPNLDEEEADFFDTYRFLMDKDLPVVITSDFLIYNFQNSTRLAFKEIEKSLFYKNLWNINKNLYENALSRYEARKADIGMVNDVVLEGQRLEAAYFAVALTLMQPADYQVNSASFADDNKFSEKEDMQYDIEISSDLAEDVAKEVEFIHKAEAVDRSPIFLYQRDYTDFEVPFDYKLNSKLNNFYLTLKWLNSVFPLYYNDETDCPECLLDKNDWMISFAAASLIADDLSASQELKNEWATIYKIVSFFTGLRQDLTYLEYNQIFSELFGPDYDIVEIFSADNLNRDIVLARAQERLAGFVFSRLEGTYERNDEHKPEIGMRLLQEFYWPNEYIFERLTGNDITANDKFDAAYREGVSCGDKYTRNDYRCLGVGLDVINLIGDVKGSLQFDYDTNFSGYTKNANELRTELDGFDASDWNSNIYWVTLDFTKHVLEDKAKEMPVFMQSSDWHNFKEQNTALGAWVNIHVGEDQVMNIYEQAGNHFGGYADCNVYNYIEPNILLIRDLIARTQMIEDMLDLLNISQKINAATLELRDLKSNLKKSLAIAEKELNSEPLNFDDCKFITSLSTIGLVKDKHQKTFRIDPVGLDIPRKHAYNTESIDGIKLVGLLYKSSGKKIIGLGPIFNYKEK